MLRHRFGYYLSSIGLALCIAGLLYVAILGWTTLQDPKRFPLTVIKVSATFEHVVPNAVERRVRPYLAEGFFHIDLNGLRRQLLDEPWVAEVVASRVWPNTLNITLREHVPVARFNKGELVTSHGIIFKPQAHTIPDDLPHFYAPREKVQQVLTYYEKMSRMLKDLGLHITQLTLSPRSAWEFKLDNGMRVSLGQSYVWQRLARFKAVYPGVFGSRGEQAVHVDMRYSNGMAVAWRDEPHNS